MKWPASLVALVDYGIVDEVLRPLMSGKEAQVYLVRCGDEERVAKVYKEAEGRSFRQRADYTEGRRTRNSRDQRAVDKRTRHGKAQDEAAWRVAEVDRIRRLRDAGVRVPEPYEFVDGVLVMELVKTAEGEPAPRLGDLSFSAAEAGAIYDQLIAETVRMLAADIVHGDLSEFNVLMAADGPVIIDFPQAVDPTSNRNARTLLLRDVQNLHRFLSRFAPGRKVRRLGEEMWKLYEEGKLKEDTALRGTFKTATGPTDTAAVLALIEDAKQDAIRESRADFDDDTELDGESEYAVSSNSSAKSSRGAEAKSAGPALRRVVDFTQDKPKPAGRGSRSRTGSKSDEGGRGRSAEKGAGRRGRRSSESSGRSRSASEKESGSSSSGGRKRAGARGDAAEGRGQQERGTRSNQRSRGRRGGARDDQRGTDRAREGGQSSRGNETRPANPRRGSRPNAERRESSGSPTRTGDRPAEGSGSRRRSRRGRRPSSGGEGKPAAQDRNANSTRDASARRNEGSRDREQDRRPPSNDESKSPRKRSRRRRRRPSGGGSDSSSS